MAKIKELDLRQLPPYERHGKIFGVLESLSNGESLRITNDHDPKPLSYQLQVEYKGQFKFNYEKSGPESWIVRITKIDSVGKDAGKNEVKEILKKLQKQSSEEIKDRAKEILKYLSPAELASIEQEIIKEGTTRKEMRKLCDVHLEVMKENLGKIKIAVKPGHPIHTLMEEHKIILDFINKLQENTNKLRSVKNFNETQNELYTLKHIAKHLLEADKHHQREEKALFPSLSKFGVTEPPEIMIEEHKELKPKKKELYETLENHKTMQYSEFIIKVKELTMYLTKELPNHIYKEDNILYPMAVQAIPEKEWKNIKKKCDEIGYCCFTPDYQKK